MINIVKDQYLNDIYNDEDELGNNAEPIPNYPESQGNDVYNNKENKPEVEIGIK
jgi:hypothetical protein